MNSSHDPQVLSALPANAPVTIRAFKYDGQEYRRWQANFSRLVPDGVVLTAIFSPVVEGRTPFFGGDGAVEYFYGDRGYNIIAGYAPGGALRACYCNICLPATFAIAPEGPEIQFIDLDLDVLVWPDGRCDLTDEDDFARNTITYGYPDNIQSAARDAVSALLRAVAARHAPFDQIGLPRLP